MAEVRLDARRAGLLAAMGVEVYRLRALDAKTLASVPAATQPIDAAPAANDAPVDSTAPRVLIVCAAGQRRDGRLASLFAQLPRALGAPAAAVGWCEASADGAVAPPVDARAYLVFGTAMARALGAQLSTAQQQASVIAVTGEPAQLPGGAVGKRALWQVLKPVARALREPA
jgi:hypothetical protein